MRRNPIKHGCIESEWLLVEPGGRRRRHHIRFRAYTLAELAKMLDVAGLTVAQTWGDFEGRDYRLDSRRLILLAEKRGG